MRVMLLSEEAYDRVRHWILGGRIQAGRIIRESSLARELNMSRTPIREALRRLQAEGLIAPITQGGYVLVELDPNALIDVYAVLGSLQAMAARVAAMKRNRSDLGKMADLLEEMEGAIQRGDDAEITRLNGEFHDAVARASQNEYLRTSLRSTHDIVIRYRPHLTPAGLREHAHTEHRDLLDAIEAQNPDLAEQIARRHIEHALRARLETFAREKDSQAAGT